MIERLLAGEGALARGELDAAERLFAQVADADPRNAIAVVGLARVARRRDDPGRARLLAEQALAIDPDEVAATRLLADLAARPAEPESVPEPAEPELEPEPELSPTSVPAARSGGWRGWLARLLRRR